MPTTVAAPVDPLASAIDQAPDDPVAPSDAERNADASAAGDDDGSSPWLWVAGLIIGFVVALGLSLGIVLAAKRSRRRRRRQATEPSARVQGAWHEALDRLAEHGVRPERSMSTTDVVRVAGAVVDGAVVPPLEALAALANVSRFNSSGASPEEATTAWEAADLVTAGLRDACTARRRLSAAVSPAPLLTRRR